MDGYKGKFTKSKLKDVCKKSSIGELQKLLNEKHTDLMKLNFELTRGRHTRIAYTPEIKGNVDNIKKQIAVIKTFLNVKMKGDISERKGNTEESNKRATFKRR